MHLDFYTRKMNPNDIANLKKFSTINEMLLYAASQFGEQKAIFYKQNGQICFLTYNELLQNARGTAGTVSAANRIAILANPCAGWIQAFLGIASAGKTAVLLPNSAPKEALAALTMMTGADGIVYGEGFEETAKEIAKNPRVKLCVPLDELHKGEPVSIETTANKESIAALFFTSGTTARNKCVPLSHGVIMANAYNGMLGVPINRGDRCLAVLPLFHVFGLIRSVLTILNEGGEVYLNENIKTFFPNLACAKPTTLILVPALAEVLLDLMDKNGPAISGGALKTIITGGSAMKPKTKEQFLRHGINLLQGYGLTEASMVSGNTEETEHLASVGKTYPGNEAKIVDGEIWIKGESVFSGYLLEADNAEAFEDGWFKTGDLGCIDEDDYIYITGRKKNLIITADGENVSPEELETLIDALPSVAESLVYEAKNSKNDAVIGAEIYAPGITCEELRAKILDLNRTLPIYKQIQIINLREEPLPKNAANKIDRKALKK